MKMGTNITGYSMNGGIFSVLLGDDGENQTKLLEKIKVTFHMKKLISMSLNKRFSMHWQMETLKL